MPFQADAVTLTLIVLLLALVIGILAAAASAKSKAKRAARDISAINATIIDYFRRSGVAVSCDSTRLAGAKAFIAVVESEPMKRFRLSHIIEMTLRDHVRKSCGLQLEKIYWRFPIREAAQAGQAVSVQAGVKPASEAAAAAAAAKVDETSDEYINEGLENYRHIPKPEVTELDWETFEQMSTQERVKNEQPGNS
jgi:type II secretory pathway pseudopilin PulG